MEERVMTIARGLTRLKTIQAQLTKNGEVFRNACVSSKKKSMLADSREDVAKNHAKAKEVVEQTLQSSTDLMKEYAKIKMAISKANLETLITVAGQTMTMAEAMLVRRDIQNMYRQVLTAYGQSMQTVTHEVNKHNDVVLSNSGTPAEDKKVLMAEVVSFIPFYFMQELNNFVQVFMAEIDGTLNEVNALTEIQV